MWSSCRSARQASRARRARRSPGRCPARRLPRAAAVPSEPSGVRYQQLIRNLIGSEWRLPAQDVRSLPVFNPATAEVIEQVPLSDGREVDAAVRAAAGRFQTWSPTAVMDRGRLMFRFKAALRDRVQEPGALATPPYGETLDQARRAARPR